MSPNAMIVVADSEEAITEVLAELLTDAGYRVQCARIGIAVVDLILTNQPGLALLDLSQGGMSGLDVLRAVRQQGSTVPVVIMTTDPRQAQRLEAQGATTCLSKPFEVTELLRCVEYSLQQRQHLAIAKVNGTLAAHFPSSPAAS